MFTVKARTYYGDGSSILKAFMCDNFEIQTRKVEDEFRTVVSCGGTTVDRSQDPDFHGQDVVNLGIFPPEVTSTENGERPWHEVFIENELGKTTEVVRA